jgi:hypothetical protein
MDGVFPVFENKFKVGTKGETSTESDMSAVMEMETFSVKMDGKVEEWTPMDAEGWTKRLMTGKGFTITLSGKRYNGDPGNDYVAGLAWKSGRDCSSKFVWEFPSGGKLEFNCVINVTAPGGGDSTNVDKLEFDVMSHGKPVYTPPVPSGG